MTPITTPAAERCPYPELEERVRARLDAQEVLARQARERREEAREYAERRLHDELVERRRRNGRWIRRFVGLSFLAGIVAFVDFIATWVAHGVDATVASTPALKRSLVTATTAGWQWGMIAMAVVACLAIVIVFSGTRFGE